jgi:hypothetical protein
MSILFKTSSFVANDNARVFSRADLRADTSVGMLMFMKLEGETVKCELHKPQLCSLDNKTKPAPFLLVEKFVIKFT